jgi:hypothetical protein
MRASLLNLLRRTGAALVLVAAAPIGSQSPSRLESLLNDVAARLETGAGYKNWTATAIQTTTELDRRGAAEKVTVLTKAVKVADGRRRDEVVKAVETEKGVSKDVTAKHLAEAEKRRAEEAQRRAERARQGEASRRDERPSSGAQPSRRRSAEMDIMDIVPFAAERRDDFAFSLRETADPAGRPVVRIDVKAKEKDRRNWEGTYTVDPATGDILRAEVRPSEYPKFVKELVVEAEVDILDGKYMVFKRTFIRVSGGFLFIKRVRMTIEEVYSDVRVVDGGGRP